MIVPPHGTALPEDPGREMSDRSLLRPRTPPFVGRQAELQELMRLLGRATRGETQLALVEGPAGIGKTRLAEEVMDRAGRRGARVAMGRCWPAGEAPPLWPWRAILRDLGAPEGLLDETQAEAGQGRFARFLAVLETLRRAGAPVVVVLDDAHLADPASLLLARFLSRERKLPLLLVLTRRDGAGGEAETLETLGELDREATVIALSGLSPSALRAWVAATGSGRPDPALVDALAALTHGNPLHLRSVTLQGERGGGALGGLGHAIARIVEGLAPVDRHTIAVAAVLGPEVWVHEVARVAEVAPSTATDCLGRAVEAGLASMTGDGRFAFVHDLVRQAATASLGLSERLEVHARAARQLGGHDADRLAMRAHHALAAASRSRDDASFALTIARQAARALRAVDAFEAAAALLARAAEIQSAAAVAEPAADLLVEHAESVLACGRLAQARPLFQRAARTAEAEGDPVALARAALGLGGLWVGEHRSAPEAERVRAVQRRALQALPPTEAVLRTRLCVRLAAEETYRGGSAEAVLSGVEAARRTGDAHALAEALSLCHHALLVPQHARRRLDIAGELIAAASAAGDGLLALVGLCWRTADLWLLGEPAAAAGMEEMRHRADALGCRSILFIARAMDVMLAVRAGEFERAEREAFACRRLGEEVGDADALAYHGAHLSAIRVFQGREAELADLAASIAASPTLIEERERAFAAAAALFALRAGRPEPAVEMLDRLAREGLASLPASSSWLVTMLAVVEMASALGHEEVAQAAGDALEPYADLPIMASLAVVCFGPVRRALALAARACGHADRAREHLAAAIAVSERLGHRPAAIQARAELALLSLRQAGRGDRERAASELHAAMAAGQAMGMTGLVARWRADEGAAGAVGAPLEKHLAQMAAAAGGRWRVVHAGQVATVADRVGMRYLARLLAAPGQGIPALALVSDEPESAAGRAADPLVDGQALSALRRRIRALREPAALAPAEQEELSALARELARVTGLGGRVRSFVDIPERARTAVRKAIKRAIGEIEAANPAVGRHLADAVETGAVCSYRPGGHGRSA